MTLKFLENPEIDINVQNHRDFKILADLQLARLETAQGFFSGPLVLDNMECPRAALPKIAPNFGVPCLHEWKNKALQICRDCLTASEMVGLTATPNSSSLNSQDSAVHIPSSFLQRPTPKPVFASMDLLAF